MTRRTHAAQTQARAVAHLCRGPVTTAAPSVATRHHPLNLLQWPMYAQTLLAMVAGGAVGLWLGGAAGPLGDIAKYIVEVIKFLAVPLLFLAIFDGVIGHAFAGRGIAAMFMISLGNAVGAVSIALVVSNVFHPGQWLDLSKTALDQGKPVAAADASAGNIAGMLAGSSMMQAIVLALLLGLVVVGLQRWWAPPAADSGSVPRHLLARAAFLARLSRGTTTALGWSMRAMGWIVRLTPLAVFGAVAKVLGQHGLSMLTGLAAYVGFCLLGMVLHVLLVYHGWVVGIARIGVARFWRAAREPVVYAFGINSSLATLPVTLQALDRLGVSPGSARLSACVGTNFNNDGILLYEVVAVLFLAQAWGIDMPLAQQLTTAAVCVAATIGVGGIPEAGIISLSLVLGAVHMPVEAIPLLLSVDWLVARCRSAVNVMGDMTVAVAIDVVRDSRPGEQRTAPAT